MSETTVVLGFADRALQEEVLDFLDRIPRVRVVGTALDAPGLARTIRELRPDAAVAAPGLLDADLDGAAVLVVDQQETTAGLRAAVRAGARGFYVWPGERDILGREASRATRRSPKAEGSGRIVAVLGARGGAGATFVATSLAAALASKSVGTALVDLDTFYGDVTAALGIPDGGAERTSAELVPVLDEVTTEHIDKVLHDHPTGFRALLASPGVKPDDLVPTFGPLRTSFELVVLHVPRALAEARAALSAADEILVVLTLDVLAFRAARRAVSFLESLGVGDRVRFVVNRAAKGEVVPEDVERVFGTKAACVIPVDPRVARAQNRGELVTLKGRVGRRIASLAASLAETR